MDDNELAAALRHLRHKGLTFSQCVEAFADPAEARTVEKARGMAREGELEVDEITVVSRGEDNGAYVMAWLWVEDDDDADDDADEEAPNV